MTYKQLPKKHFLALFITALSIFFYVKIVFDITPPPFAYVLIALPFLGFATYYYLWDIVMKYKIHIGIAVTAFVAYQIFFPEKKDEEKCVGDEKCKSAVQQRLSSTGKMDLGMRHDGDGTFYGIAQDLKRQVSFSYTISTDCDCKVTSVNIIQTER